MENNVYQDWSRNQQQLGYSNGAQPERNQGRSLARGRNGHSCNNPNGRDNKKAEYTNNRGQGSVCRSLVGLPDEGQNPNAHNFHASPFSLSGTASPFVPTTVMIAPSAGSPTSQHDPVYQPACQKSSVASSMATAAIDLPRTEVKVMQQPAAATLPEIKRTEFINGKEDGNDIALHFGQGAAIGRPGMASDFHREDPDVINWGAATMPATPMLHPNSVLETSKTTSVTGKLVDKDSFFTFVKLMIKHLRPDRRDSFEKRISGVLCSLFDRQEVLEHERSIQSTAYFKNYEEERFLSQEQMRHQDQVTHCYSLVVRSSGNEKKWHEETVLKHMSKAQKYHEAARNRRDRVEEARISLHDIDRALTENLVKTQHCLIKAFIEVENDQTDVAKHVCIMSDAVAEIDLSLGTVPTQTIEQSATHNDQADVLHELKESIDDAMRMTDTTKTLKSPQSHSERLEDSQTTSTCFQPRTSGQTFPTNTSSVITENTGRAEEDTITKQTPCVSLDVSASANTVDGAVEDATRADDVDMKPDESVSKQSRDAGNHSSQAGTTKKKQKKKFKPRNKNESVEGQSEHAVKAIEGTSSPSIVDRASPTNSHTGSGRHSRPDTEPSMRHNSVHGSEVSVDTKHSERISSRSKVPNLAAGDYIMHESGKSGGNAEEFARTTQVSRIPKAVDEAKIAEIANVSDEPSMETADGKVCNINGLTTSHARNSFSNDNGLGRYKATKESEAAIVPASQNIGVSSTVETNLQPEYEKSTNGTQPTQNVDQRKHLRKASTTAPFKGALQEKPNSTHEVKKLPDDKRGKEVVSSKHGRNKKKKKKKSTDNKPAMPEKPTKDGGQTIGRSSATQMTWAQHLGSGQS